MRVLHGIRDFGRVVWGFVHPSRTAGRIPLGRFTIVMQLIAALLFVGYTMSKKALRLPFSTKAYEIEVVFPDARGLDQLDEPGAAVAGTPFGRVTEVVYAEGRAVATLTLDPDVRGKVFNDATASIRPGSAIQNLVVNVDPGSPRAGELPDGGRIESSNTDVFVAIDELTSTLDADTRAYVQILVTEAQRALRDSESELRRSLDELGTLAETATPVSRTLAKRRELLARLVGELDEVATVLGERQSQLAETIDAGSQTLEVTAAREAELAQLTRELGPTLVEADRALAAVNELTEPLEPALDALAPTADDLARGLEATRSLIPQTAALNDVFKSLIEEGSRPLALMVEGTEGLRQRLRRQVPVARDLTALAFRLDEHKAGLAQLADTLSGALSVNDNGGTYGQVNVLGIEPLKPENFGLPARAARSAAGEPSQLERLLAQALTRACLDGEPTACLLRTRVKGLPSLGSGGGG